MVVHHGDEVSTFRILPILFLNKIAGAGVLQIVFVNSTHELKSFAARQHLE